MYSASMAFPYPITGLAQLSEKVFVALSHLNIFTNRFAEYNDNFISTENV
jgi:hypothetical protein